LGSENVSNVVRNIDGNMHHRFPSVSVTLEWACEAIPPDVGLA